jgi:hypothetical protein
MFTKIKAVRVQKIIVSGPNPNLIGCIRYDNLSSGKTLKKGHLPLARPLFQNISQYPAVNEIVYVLGGPSMEFNNDGSISSYYLPPLNILGSPNHNALPNQLLQAELEEGVETGLDDHFQEINDIRPLLPYEGDIIIEGRYGNSIRFGSTISGSNTSQYYKGKNQPNNWSKEGNTGNPITIIRNGQTDDPSKANFEHILEDVNKDNSTIYLCSKQQITNFQKSGTSPNDHPSSYKHML